ncbi:hypothetical protein Bca52824_020096 [Brassica carinata]|uniref:Uncharacterized protein n=1 Tax=Brassica carinata TaxID=52824 RepID=A0A8X8AY36_BRACI|nr:hypothetical protein Bca52824_020096 [Brassica carinata]
MIISELRPGMPELSKFNHSSPLCALEKLRDVSAMENRTSAAPRAVEPSDPVYYRDDQPAPQA